MSYVETATARESLGDGFPIAGLIRRLVNTQYHGEVLLAGRRDDLLSNLDEVVDAVDDEDAISHHRAVHEDAIGVADDISRVLVERIVVDEVTERTRREQTKCDRRDCRRFS